MCRLNVSRSNDIDEYVELHGDVFASGSMVSLFYRFCNPAHSILRPFKPLIKSRALTAFLPGA